MSTVLPEPNFIDRDPQAITDAMIAAYEEATGKTLQPAQVERLIIDMIAYQENVTRIAVQEACKQNLVAFARFPMLDYLGQLVDVMRLVAKSATATIRFTLSAVQAFNVAIPLGTRVRTQDGAFIFATSSVATIGAGALYVDVPAAAAVGGVASNNYPAGQIATVMDAIANVATAVSTTDASGGSDAEDDEHLRERIREAPERFSVAGPSGAYRFWAMSADPSIIDVAVTSFEYEPGLVRLYVLMSTGLPSLEILDFVEQIVSDDKVRPLSDDVWVGPPAEVDFDITAALTVYRSADSDAVMAAAQAAAVAFAADRRAGLGRDIIPSQVIAALSVPGVHTVALSSPTTRILDVNEWANCQTITLTLAGLADG